MSVKSLKITEASWDKRPKTKFLRVEGTVEVNSFEDMVNVSIAEPQGINENILLLNVEVASSDGPMKPQPAPFYFRHMTHGAENWTHIQVANGDESDTSPITVYEWAGSPELA
ncbi:MAG: hypothetical protein RPU52_10125 [Candidatus Sedimenticola sp. (ex Thyasira tokunagai)]